MMASAGVQAKSCCWLLLLCCFFFTQGSTQNANCSIATEQPVFDGIDPPSGNSTIIYRIFGELLDQVVDVDITVNGRPNMRTIIQINSSEILFRFHVIVARLPTTANVSLRPNNSACETFSRTVSLHRFRKFVHVWGAPSSVKPNLVLVSYIVLYHSIADISLATPASGWRADQKWYNIYGSYTSHLSVSRSY